MCVRIAGPNLAKIPSKGHSILLQEYPLFLVRERDAKIVMKYETARIHQTLVTIRLRRIIRLDLNPVLRRIMVQNSSMLDLSDRRMAEFILETNHPSDE